MRGFDVTDAGDGASLFYLYNRWLSPFYQFFYRTGIIAIAELETTNLMSFLWWADKNPAPAFVVGAVALGFWETQLLLVATAFYNVGVLLLAVAS